MASTRAQVLPSVGSTTDGGLTSGRHTLFGQLSLATPSGALVIGGMQNFRVREINGTQFRAMAGNDELEPVIGMRYWQGDGSRFQIRTADLPQLVAQAYPTVSDIDFRVLPLTLSYSWSFQSASGATTFESILWQWMQIIITEYEWSFAGAMELLGENFTFIGKGYQRQGATPTGTTGQFQNLPALWGGH